MLINKMDFVPKRHASGELKLVKDDLDRYILNGKVEILYERKVNFFELLLIVDYYISNNVLVDLILAYLPFEVIY